LVLLGLLQQENKMLQETRSKEASEVDLMAVWRSTLAMTVAILAHAVVDVASFVAASRPGYR
jgi:hypothetical protein